MLKNTVKVEKNIRYSKDLDTYYVQFSFRDYAEVKNFPTLEDARAFRDAMNAEKLRVKTDDMREKMRKFDNEEIKHAEFEVFPLNILKAMNLSDKSINPIFLEASEIESVINAYPSARETRALLSYYKEQKLLKEIGQELGLTRERVRQIILLGLKKIKNYILRYDAFIEKEAENELRERALKDLNAYRSKLVEEFKAKGIISADMVAVFGEPTFVSEFDKLHGYTNLKNIGIEELDLSTRSYNNLKRGGIYTLEDLAKKKVSDLYKIRNMGKKSVKEIKEKAKALGMTFVEE